MSSYQSPGGPGCPPECFIDRYAPTMWVEADRARRAHEAHTAPPPAPVLKRGTRFRAYPGRSVRYGSGPWIENPVYIVTSRRGETIYYRCEASPDTHAEAYATVDYLQKNGLEVLPADKED